MLNFMISLMWRRMDQLHSSSFYSG
ncbi:hypothetical protein Gotur_012782 [Gossypium turneri]